jgi:hypothetical protein
MRLLMKEAGVAVQTRAIQKGSEVKVRKPGSGEMGTWRVLG